MIDWRSWDGFVDEEKDACIKRRFAGMLYSSCRCGFGGMLSIVYARAACTIYSASIVAASQRGWKCCSHIKKLVVHSWKADIALFHLSSGVSLFLDQYSHVSQYFISPLRPLVSCAAVAASRSISINDNPDSQRHVGAIPPASYITFFCPLPCIFLFSPAPPIRPAVFISFWTFFPTISSTYPNTVPIALPGRLMTAQPT